MPGNHDPNVRCLAVGATGTLAPLATEGAIDSAVVVPWLTEWLLPQLAPGTSIVCDTRSVHRHAAVPPAVVAAGCHLVYLRASSADLHPIELVFATLKAHLRAVAARSFEALVPAIGTGLAAVTTTDIAGCYRHCGFPQRDHTPRPLCNSL